MQAQPRTVTAAPVASIVATATAVPPHVITQRQLRDGLGSLYRLPPRRLEALGLIFDNAHVERRHSVMPMGDLARLQTFDERNRAYGRHALTLAREAAERCLATAGRTADELDMIVTASCTGTMRPSLAVQLARALGAPAGTSLLPISTQGCAAGAAALARGHEAISGGRARRVLVVSVEISSVNFQPDDDRQANLVSSALFGDGSAAALLEADACGAEIVAAESHLFPDSLDVLGFDVADDGLHMILSPKIPALVGESMGGLVHRMRAGVGEDEAPLRWFALHPGGRNVLTGVEQALALGRGATASSWEMLRRYGNLSSAAVLFVLDHERRERRPCHGAQGLLAAFGPGFAAELLLLRWRSPDA